MRDHIIRSLIRVPHPLPSTFTETGEQFCRRILKVINEEPQTTKTDATMHSGITYEQMNEKARLLLCNNKLKTVHDTIGFEIG